MIEHLVVLLHIIIIITIIIITIPSSIQKQMRVAHIFCILYVSILYGEYVYILRD
ncbi:hypothetical protein PP707_06155 [Acetobacter pasteurianus]|nr:hypothetical protein [Acetobacter pasteurianus]